MKPKPIVAAVLFALAAMRGQRQPFELVQTTFGLGVRGR